jgi:type 1 glutamine amidotransferase
MKTTKRITRRNILQKMGTAAAMVTLPGSKSASASQTSNTKPGGKPRTIALIGDRYHNSDYIRVALDRLFKELDLPVDFTTNYYDLSAKLLEPYQLFIGFRDNMIWPGGYLGPDGWPNEGMLENPGEFPPSKSEEWITEDQGKAVQDFVSSGKGFYSLHNNGFVSRSSKNYRDVQGGYALGHPNLRPFRVRVVNKEHPVTEGVEDFMVTDEQHFLIYDKDPKNILLHGENIDGLTFGSRGGRGRGAGGQNDAGSSGGSNPASNASPDLGTVSISGWAHEYGQGRVVFTAIGHTIHAMWQPEYLKMQKNAVRWLLKMS